jgi:hypothetical protein
VARSENPVADPRGTTAFALNTATCGSPVTRTPGISLSASRGVGVVTHLGGDQHISAGKPKVEMRMGVVVELAGLDLESAAQGEDVGLPVTCPGSRVRPTPMARISATSALEGSRKTRRLAMGGGRPHPSFTRCPA